MGARLRHGPDPSAADIEADVRAVLREDEERLNEFERELDKLRRQDLKPREKAVAGAKLVAKALPAMVSVGGMAGL